MERVDLSSSKNCEVEKRTSLGTGTIKNYKMNIDDYRLGSRLKNIFPTIDF